METLPRSACRALPLVEDAPSSPLVGFAQISDRCGRRWLVPALLLFISPLSHTPTDLKGHMYFKALPHRQRVGLMFAGTVGLFNQICL